MRNKRKINRKSISELVKLTSKNETILAEVIDISEDGIGVLVDRSFNIKEQCILDVDYLKDSTQYAVKCTILNKTPMLIKQKLRLGLEFKWESEAQKGEIQTKIKNLLLD